MGRFAPALDPPVTNGHRPRTAGRNLRSVETLTASAASASETISTGTSVTTSASYGTAGWQSEVWGHFDVMPELHYGTQFVGSCFSRIMLRLGWKNDAGEVGPCFDEDDIIDEDLAKIIPPNIVMQARGILHAFQDPLGGTSSLLEGIGKNLFVVGELHLVARDYHDESGAIVARRWEVLSTSEIRKKREVRYDAATGKPLSPEFERITGNNMAEDIPPDRFVLRIFRRHPRFSHQADASTRPLIDTMELLTLLTRQLRATVCSRLAGAGVLFIPTEMDFADDETAPEGSEGVDPFARELVKTMTMSITDRGNPASVVPFVVRADADLIPAIHHLVFDSKDDDMAIAKMDAMMLRFEQGIDLPVEVVAGHQQTTFANAVSIDESTFKAHLEPSVNLVCGFLTAGYLWPSLDAPRPVDITPGESILLPYANDPITRLVIYPDVSALVTHENREANAIKALEQLPPIISSSAGRRALGFNDADAMDDDERNEWIRIRQLIQVKESIKGEDLAPGGISMTDPAVQNSLNTPDPAPNPPGGEGL